MVTPRALSWDRCSSVSISDTDSGIKGSLSSFADGMKLSSAVDTLEDGMSSRKTGGVPMRTS